MDEGLNEPIRATRLLAWATAGLIALGAVSAGVVAGSDDSPGDRVVSAAGVEADGVEVATTVTTTVATTVPPTLPPTTVQAPMTTTTPRPTTTGPSTTQAPRATTTTSRAATSTTAAGVMLTVVNNSSSAVFLKVNGRSFDLIPGQKVGPVPITRSADGNDIVELRLVQEPTCGMGDADTYFPRPGNYVLTIESSPGACNPPSGPTASVRYRVTPA